MSSNLELPLFDKPPVSRLRKRAEPFIKWAGGKQSLVSQITPNFPKSYKKYYEPFIGGGSIFFSLEHHTGIISDQNDWLIDTYLAIRDNWKAVVEELINTPNTKEDFLRLRAVNPSTLNEIKKAALFIYLNKTCFRGLFRVNRSGQFNVPYGAYDRRYCDPQNIEAVSVALLDTTILKGDFEAALVGIESGDFVYFDPPYYKLGGYSDFNRYTSAQFRETDHLRLASLCNELDSLGVKWAVSNSDTEFTRSLFAKYKAHPIKARREINLKSQDRNVSELLFTNY